MARATFSLLDYILPVCTDDRGAWLALERSLLCLWFPSLSVGFV